MKIDHNALRPLWAQIQEEGAGKRSWKTYAEFFCWAVERGWQPGLTVERMEVSRPWTPGNAQVANPFREPPKNPETMKAIRQWDSFVNRFRRQLGLPPLERRKS